MALVRWSGAFLYVIPAKAGIHRQNSGVLVELVTINELVDMVAEISGKRITKRHDLSKPQGVRGRNSDNNRLRGELGWEPSIPLREGLTPTYRWIESELRTAGRVPQPA